MVDYYAPLMTSLKTMIAGYKSGSLVGASFATALSLEAVMELLSLNFLGVSLGLLLLTCFFILIDWWTGSAAANKRAKKAMEEENNEEYEKNRLKSSKVTFTIFKFISLYLWLMLSYGVTQVAIADGFIEDGLHVPASFGLGTLLRIFSIVPVLLFCFREFVSIGENVKSIYGKVPYLFTLGERLFDILQFNFISRIDSATKAGISHGSRLSKSAEKEDKNDDIDKLEK